MSDCLFCRIASGELESKRVYEDETVVAFQDIHPQAPVHLLVIPRRHLVSLADATAADRGLLGHLLEVAAHLAKKHGISESGYRVVTNTGEKAGQSVMHLHLHVLGGRGFSWPPG